MIRKFFSIGLALSLMLFAGNLEASPPGAGKMADLEKRLQVLEKREALRHKKGESEVHVYFKNGFKMRSLDNQFKFQVGGRIMHDWGFFSEDNKFKSNFRAQENGARFRRARIFMAGMLYKTIGFKWDIDVDGGSKGVTFKDMFITMPHIPIIGNFRVGHLKRPASLDSVTSSKYNTFIERSLTNTFFKTRSTGFAFFNQHLDKRLTWFVFVNKTSGSRPPDFRIDGDWNVTSRITGLPYMSEDGKRWVHLGVSWSYEAARTTSEDGIVKFQAARDSEITAHFLDTGNITANKQNIVGLEGAVNWNQFGVQSEYVMTDIDRGIGPNGQLDAYYVQGTWYVTGENRRYKKSAGAIGRFRPNQNFSWKKNWRDGQGTGALQLAVRYAMVDLNDASAGIAGGEQHSLTFGANWELNPMSRIMYNYVRADFDNGIGADAGTLHSNIVRFQVDF